MKAKFLLLGITICFVLVMFGGSWKNFDEPYMVTEAQAVETISELMKQYKAGDKWTREFAGGEECYAFAHFVFNSICKRGERPIGDGAKWISPKRYKYQPKSGDIVEVGCLDIGYTKDELRKLFSQIKSGDFIQAQNWSDYGDHEGGPHSMIAVSYDAKKERVEIYDANGVDKDTIGHYYQTLDEFMSQFIGVSLYRYWLLF